MANIEERKKLQLQIQPQVQAVNMETRREFRDILTPDQLVTLQQNFQDFRKRFGAPGLGGRAVDTQDNPPTNNYASTNVGPQ